MDKLNWALAVDVILVLVVVWKLITGRRDGMVKKLGGLAALVGALFAGDFVSKRFSALVAERWIGPALDKWFTHIRESLGLEDMLDNLSEILQGVSLPQFLKQNVSELVSDRLGAAKDSIGVAVDEASQVVAQRLAGWLLFIVAAILAYALIRVIFDGVLDPLIRKLPIIGTANALLGAILGAVQGAIIALVLLWLAYHLLPGLSEAGGPFAPECVERSFLTKFCFQTFPNLFAPK